MAPREVELLRQLAERCGILDGYHDIWGEHHPTSDATRRAILEAMGIGVGGEADLRAALDGFSAPLDTPQPGLLAGLHR